MAQGDVEQPQMPETNYKMGRMNGDDGHPQKPMKKREGRPRGPRNGPGGVNSDFPLRIMVGSEYIGAIIGRQGSTIHQITQETHARVDIDRKNEPHTVIKTVFIYGLPENCAEACKRILYIIKQESANMNRSELTQLKVYSHNNQIGRLIGKGGLTIRQIMRDTNTKINVSSSDVLSVYNQDRIITLHGDSIEDLAKAVKLIAEKLRESYEADLRDFVPRAPMFLGMNPMAMYPQSNSYGMNPYGYPGMMSPPMHGMHQKFPSGSNTEETTYLYIHKNAVGGVIGTKGSYIRNVIRYSGAFIKIAPLEPDQTEQMERKVTIVGNSEAQWKAQFLIYEKIRESGFFPGNDDIHLKIEVLVPTYLIGRVIGRKGQNIKELQRVTGSLIKIPKVDESEANMQSKDSQTTAIRILGSFFAVESAQRRIRSIIQNNLFLPLAHPSSKSVSPTLENHQQHQ